MASLFSTRTANYGEDNNKYINCNNDHRENGGGVYYTNDQAQTPKHEQTQRTSKESFRRRSLLQRFSNKRASGDANHTVTTTTSSSSPSSNHDDPTWKAHRDFSTSIQPQTSIANGSQHVYNSSIPPTSYGESFLSMVQHGYPDWDLTCPINDNCSDVGIRAKHPSPASIGQKLDKAIPVSRNPSPEFTAQGKSYFPMLQLIASQAQPISKFSGSRKLFSKPPNYLVSTPTKDRRPNARLASEQSSKIAPLQGLNKMAITVESLGGSRQPINNNAADTHASESTKSTHNKKTKSTNDKHPKSSFENLLLKKKMEFLSVLQHDEFMGLPTPPASLRKIKHKRSQQQLQVTSDERSQRSSTTNTPPASPTSPQFYTPPVTPREGYRGDSNVFRNALQSLRSKDGRQSDEQERETSLSENNENLGRESPTNLPSDIPFRSVPSSPQPPQRPFALLDVGNSRPSTPTLSLRRAKGVLAISTPLDEPVNPGLDKESFLNPRPLPQLPEKHDQQLNAIKSCFEWVSKHAENEVLRRMTSTHGVRYMVAPVVRIATAIGCPNKEPSVRNGDHKPQHVDKEKIRVIRETDRAPTPAIDIRPPVDVLSELTNVSLRVPSRPSSSRSLSRLSALSLSITNNSVKRKPRGYASLVQSLPNDDPSRIWSFNSSSEFLQTGNSPPASAPVSAFEDDSSEDEDYFGELKQIPGIGGMRNLRRLKAVTKRLSRESLPRDFFPQNERSSSRLSLSRRTSTESYREALVRRVSTETFAPLRQNVGKEEITLLQDNGSKTQVKELVENLASDQVLHLKDENGMDHLVYEREEGKIWVVSGTIECLIAELCNPLRAEQDEGFVDVFIRASGLHITTVALLKALIMRFRKSDTKIQERILHVLSKWIRTQPEDIIESETATEMFSVFLGEASCWGHFAYANRLTKTYNQLQEKLMSYQESINTGRFININTEIDTLRSQFSSFVNASQLLNDAYAVSDVAQYFSALDFVLFRDGSQMRTLCLWWTTFSDEQKESITWESEIPLSFKSHESPTIERVSRLIRRTSMMKHWVMVEVLQVRSSTVKAQLISKFIDIALCLRDYGNFQSAICIIEALHSLQFLERTWEKIPISQIRDFSDLKPLLDQKHYINVVSKNTEPVIPYFPFFIKAATNLLKQSTHASARYNNASRTHVDAAATDNCGCSRASKLAPCVFPNSPDIASTTLEIKKYRSVVREVAAHRNRIRQPYPFAFNLSRDSYGFKMYVPGRIAFGRDSLNERQSSISESSSSDRVSTWTNLDDISEMVEKRILAAWAMQIDTSGSEDQRDSLVTLLRQTPEK